MADIICNIYIYISGAAVIALGALEKYGDLNLKIVPVGLNYSSAHEFRSTEVVEFGTPISVDMELVEAFKAGGEGRRAAVTSLLNEIKEGMMKTIVPAQTAEDFQCISVACSVLSPEQDSNTKRKQMLSRSISFSLENFKTCPEREAQDSFPCYSPDPRERLKQ